MRSEYHHGDHPVGALLVLPEAGKTLGLDGSETIELKVRATELKPGMDVTAEISRPDGSWSIITLKSRMDTTNEAAYFKAGGILQHVLAGYLAR